MSLVFTVFMYMIFFVAAPYIANFYKSPDLCLVLRVITILLFFKSIVSVIRAKGTRELQFKRMVLSAFISNFSAGIIAIVPAYMDGEYGLLFFSRCLPASLIWLL